MIVKEQVHSMYIMILLAFHVAQNRHVPPDRMAALSVVCLCLSITYIIGFFHVTLTEVFNNIK
jgi:hypothetical protein